MTACVKAGFVAVFLLILLGGARIPSAAAGQPQRVKKLTAVELLETAHTLFAQGDYEAARQYYLEALPSYPQSFDLLKNLAYCYYSSGPRGFVQAAHYYSQAYEINPNSREAAEKLAKCLTALNRHGEAAAILRKLAELPAAPPEAWKSVAEAYALAHRIPEAEAAYDAYLQRNPADLQARASLGDLYRREKAYAKALEQFRVVLSVNPNFSSALIGTARVLSWQGQYEESLRLYDRVLRLNPTNGEAESGKAFVLLWMGRAEEAQALLSKLHQRYPRDSEIKRGLEQAQAALDQKALAAARRTGDTAQVMAFYRQRLAKNPNDLTALRALATMTANLQHCSESLGYARKALELSPDDLTLELGLARSLSVCQQYAEAIARYRRFLQFQPKAEGPLSELGHALLKARRFTEAVEVLRNVLQLNPQNFDARLNLAQASAATGDYAEALLRYDEVLKASPEYYDALQGKAYVLYWTSELTQARTIFQSLAAKQPNDPQNAEALKNIARAEEEARWIARRPPPGAPPQDFLRYYQERLESYPDDRAAIKGLAYTQAQLKNYPDAIRSYRRVVEKYPDDRDAKIELARLLGWDKQYEASIALYREVLKDTPNDSEVLESLAGVYLWSGSVREALEIYQRLLAKSPSDIGRQLEVARLKLRLKDYPGAREVLASLLSADPQNHEARLRLAQMDLSQGDRENALKHFDLLLAQNPQDPDALSGKAQISYYQGDLPQAHAAATTLVKQRPDNFDAIFLLASIEHARHNRRATLTLLDQAARLSPNNPEVVAMRNRVREESAVSVHTSASFAREIGPSGRFGSPRGFIDEDLRAFSYGIRFEFSRLPRTDSYLSLNYLPSESPLGGIRGAVGPGEFLYRQTTRLSPRLTLRGGAGLVRFGPGKSRDLPGQPEPVPTATLSPLALAGFSLAPTKKLSFDLNATRSAITYTPTAVRLGVMENRLDGGLNFFFTPRTELHLGYFYGYYLSQRFDHVSFVNGRRLATRKADHDQGQGGSALFNRNVIRSDRLTFDVGYAGLAYGYIGRRGNVFLGFFNPRFYQRHLATVHVSGKLWGPLGYDFSGGVGVQQVEQGQALTRALILSPAFTLKASSRLSLTAGYTHYNSAQSLGTLRGKAVRLSTDWKF